MRKQGLYPAFALENEAQFHRAMAYLAFLQVRLTTSVAADHVPFDPANKYLIVTGRTFNLVGDEQLDKKYCVKPITDLWQPAVTTGDEAIVMANIQDQLTWLNYAEPNYLNGFVGRVVRVKRLENIRSQWYAVTQNGIKVPLQCLASKDNAIAEEV